MKRYIILFSVILLSIGNLNAQFFNVSNINTDEFPTVSTIFVAKDANDEFIKNPTKNQFIIEEDGKVITQTDIDIECFEGGEIPELSIVLVVDISGSMKEPFDENKPNDTPWERVKEGVESFLDNIKFVGETKVALVTFNGDSYEGCPFTNVPQDIIDSLDAIKPTGGTKYTPPYIKNAYELNGKTYRPSVVSLLSTRPANLKRIAVFLTDGKPDQEPETIRIVDSLNYYNITAYNITFLTNMHESLSEISQKTNGVAFVVERKEDLETIYSEIAREAQESYFCKLSWISKYPCYDYQRNRTVDFTFTGISPYGRATRQYTIDESNIPIRKWDFPVYSFGNPEVGPLNSVTKKLQLIIKSIDLKYEDIELIPSGQGFTIVEITDSEGNIVNKNTIIPEGDTIYVEINFEQFDLKTLRTSTLTMSGGPCPTATELVGGTTDVILDSPNGGEVFTTCDTVEINWSGIDKDADVHISYSNDSFASDSTYISTTNGNNYSWRNLPQAAGEYKLKLHVDPVTRYLFALNEQSNGQSHGASVELSNDELYVYAVGHFTDSMTVEGTKHYSEGNEDIFINKYNSAGRLIWTNALGGEGLDSASGVCVDDEEQVYFTGTTTKGSKFKGAGVGGELPGSIFFVAKTSPNGGNYTVRTIYAKSPYTTFQIWGTSIRYDAATERIIVRGGWKDPYKYITPLKTYDFPASGGRFTAYYDKELKFLDLQFQSFPGNFSDNKATTADGKSTYTIGTLNSDKSFGPFDLKHKGRGDFYLTRLGQNEPSVDISDNTFTIEKPTLIYSDNSIIQFEDTPINETSYESRSKFVINTSILPIEIDTITITGPNKDEFNLDRDFEGTIENGADNAFDVHLKFNPQSSGLRKAFLNIYGVCSDVITVELNGNGICDLVIIDKYNMGASNLDIPLDRTIENVLINNNNVPVMLDPKIINDVTNNFDITNIQINKVDIAWGNPFELQPKDTLTVSVQFLSSTEGIKYADLTYNPVGIGCGNLSTNLTATGSNTDLSYEEVNFAKKRVQTVNYLNLEIVNNGNLKVNITDVYLENTGVFELEKPSKLEVDAGQTLFIPIKFNPQVEGVYSEDIFIVINPGDEPLTLNSVKGIGENPTAIGSIDCNGNGVQNKTNIVNLILTNNSTISEAEVESIDIDPSSDYTFVGGAKTLNNISNIAINNYISIPLEFTPTTVGINNLDLTINSNTSIGNNVDDLLDDPLVDKITLNCNAVPADGQNILAFKGVLVCDSYEITDSITNSNQVSPLNITEVNLTQVGTDFSIIDISNSTVINPNSNHKFKIAFAPTTEGQQNAILEFKMIQDGSPITRTFTITGIGKRIKYYTVENEKDIIPGGTAKLVVNAEVPELDYLINELDVILKYNPNVISFEEDNMGNIIAPISNSIDWTWSNSNVSISQGFVEFNGIGTDELSAGNHELFEINYIMYLGAIKNDIVSVGDFPGCTNQKFDDVLEVNLSGVCALENRLVKFGLAPTQIKTEYNSNIDMVRTEFTVMFDDMDVTINIMDINGNLVESKIINNMNQGRYEAVIEASNISSGLYFVRYSSGAYTDTQKLMIVK